jgi:branched-chain amino acid aminotransferase
MVFLNGKFVSEAEARVSAFDAGVQHGVGLFETMLAVGGGMAGGTPAPHGPRVVRLGEHLARLIASARELGLSDSLREGALAEAVALTVEKSGLARARVRVTVTGGDLNLLGRSDAATERRRDGEKSIEAAEPTSMARARVDPTVMIAATAAAEYPGEMFERGVGVVIADMRVNPLDPLSGHKTLNYWGRLRELRAAAGKGAGEALVFQVTNHLAGGCVSNVFLVKGGTLLTPIARGEETQRRRDGETQSGAGGAAMPSPVLPGVTRAGALEWAGERGIEVVRRLLTIDDLLGADEVFLTNSSFGVLPVVRVEKERIGSGEVGEVTRGARGAWVEEAS